ncbi:hypothetical protein ACHFCA_25795 [Delftia tsuruhatensis]
MMTAFGGGQLQAAFVTGLDGAGMLQAGKVKYLAVATPQRTNVWACRPSPRKCPASAASPGSACWRRPALPDAIAAKLNAAVEYAVTGPTQKLRRPQHRDTCQQAGGNGEADPGRDGAWGEVVKRSNIRMD